MMQNSPRQNVSVQHSFLSCLSRFSLLALAVVSRYKRHTHKQLIPDLSSITKTISTIIVGASQTRTPNIGNWQNVWTDSTGFAAGWKWDYGVLNYPAIKGYPSCVVGWTFGNHYKTSNHHGFSRRSVEKNRHSRRKWSYTSWGNSNTIYDASFDIWIADSAKLGLSKRGKLWSGSTQKGLPPIKNWGQSAPGQVIRDANGNAAPGNLYRLLGRYE